MDIKSPESRSKNMSAIKCRNTKPEIQLRKALFKEGLRYRINYNLTGKPDIVFPGRKIAIFVDGCFWHGCPQCYKEPDNNKQFWKNKISQNKKRDETVNELLKKENWIVLRFWEHQVNKDMVSIIQQIKLVIGFNEQG